MADQHQPPVPTGRKLKKPLPILPIWLFKKKLNRKDVTGFEQQLVVEECSDAMKSVLERLLRQRIYVRVMAKDPKGYVYELRLMNYWRRTHILSHQWDLIVAANGLKEGDTVEGWGNFQNDGGGTYITCDLGIRRHISNGRNSTSSENQESEQVAMEEDDDETNGGEKKGVTNPRERKKPVFLFEKKMVYADTDAGLGLDRLVIENCSVKLREELEKTDDVRVFIKDPKKKVYQVRFVSQGSCYALCNGWERIVAENNLKAGDTVAGYGDIISHGKFKALLYILRNEKKNFDDEEIKGAIKGTSVSFLLFEKESLVSADVESGRLVIEECKEVVEKIMEREEKLEEYEGFVRFKAEDNNGVEYELRLSRYTREGKFILHHQWRKVVAENLLMSGDGVSCWGVAENGSIRMKIDLHN